jgi:hypothetical protein
MGQFSGTFLQNTSGVEIRLKMSFFGSKIKIPQKFKIQILAHLRHFYFLAKIAHFSLIITPEAFCRNVPEK